MNNQLDVDPRCETSDYTIILAEARKLKPIKSKWYFNAIDNTCEELSGFMELLKKRNILINELGFESCEECEKMCNTATCNI